MNFRRLSLVSEPMKGLRVFQLDPKCDHRGSFTRLFCSDELAGTEFSASIKQINRSVTKKRGAVRGLHFQRFPKLEDKLLTCLSGKILDVVVDIRRNSPTFLNVHYEELSAENAKSLLIPRGFAHGFQTLEDDCELIYFHTEEFDAISEGGINISDPILDIKLPLPVTDQSQRDVKFEMIDHNFEGISVDL